MGAGHRLGAGHSHDDVLCAVLAGGAGRRMAASGLGPKPFVELAGKPLIVHVIARLAGQVGQGMIVNTSETGPEWTTLGLPLVPDHGPPGEGPLAGLLAVLRWAAQNRRSARFVLSAPVDVPFLPYDLASCLRAATETAEVAIAHGGDRDHPTIGLWPVSLADRIDAAFQAGERAPHRFLESVTLARVSWPVKPHDPFLNVNNAHDLVRASLCCGE